MDDPGVPRYRRRGQELETALLEAGWDELVSIGYARLTMGSVAARAKTSEPVLYRRWANKDQFVLAALEHHRRTHPVPDPDTGTLRGDLVALLTAAGQALAGFYAIAAASAFAGLLADTGATPAQVREQLMGGLPVPAERALYRRAGDHGELDLSRIPETVLEMPFDLLRHDLLMNLEAPTPGRIRAIVDELFLPLVGLGPAGRPGNGRRPS